MNKDQFEPLAKSLYDRGYKRYNQQWHHEDYVIGKGFHKKDNQWEEERNGYQLLLSIYDYSLKRELWDRLSAKERTHVGIEIHIGVSRIIDERMDLTLAWHDDTTIEEVEKIAESFYNWVCTVYPEPRKQE
jgi:hypothetical protein